MFAVYICTYDFFEHVVLGSFYFYKLTIVQSVWRRNVHSSKMLMKDFKILITPRFRILNVSSFSLIQNNPGELFWSKVVCCLVLFLLKTFHIFKFSFFLYIKIGPISIFCFVHMTFLWRFFWGYFDLMDVYRYFQQEAHRPYVHLSIRDFKLTSCQRGAYLHIYSPIIIINKKNQQLYRKAAS